MQLGRVCPLTQPAGPDVFPVCWPRGEGAECSVGQRFPSLCRVPLANAPGAAAHASEPRARAGGSTRSDFCNPGETSRRSTEQTGFSTTGRARCTVPGLCPPRTSHFPSGALWLSLQRPGFLALPFPLPDAPWADSCPRRGFTSVSASPIWALPHTASPTPVTWWMTV